MYDNLDHLGMGSLSVDPPVSERRSGVLPCHGEVTGQQAGAGGRLFSYCRRFRVFFTVAHYASSDEDWRLMGFQLWKPLESRTARPYAVHTDSTANWPRCRARSPTPLFPSPGGFTAYRGIHWHLTPAGGFRKEQSALRIMIRSCRLKHMRIV
ncbi:hypothetical protein VOLCADRAFT_95148 [Volvox carteri f. nagariensis]|uniref:Uncharacterized protein n=1 Tax=Volvox carteri f. nagariensis TaxID=3068 RepID=D8U6Q9_VOLCA|nr:uncharacterized protein VOLCADRAFT_95148 [Volvox carteri f. nagariensis]EFJ44552.1 hypothetical protein VOLCADRAFT_95148 [Volvox carteri f. nagariensis]|eukprot:XP_002954402.1 hypothetical protein VOLCADRAFT_95148 [Volvox carteri f. nagariensis]